jgi:uncharacterized protein YukE
MIRETIQKEMQSRKHTVAFLAKEIGSHTAPLYNYFKGKAGLSYKSLVKICIYYDLVLIKKF